MNAAVGSRWVGRLTREALSMRLVVGLTAVSSPKATCGIPHRCQTISTN